MSKKTRSQLIHTAGRKMPKRGFFKKSSLEARRLIRITMKGRTQREAARLLRLPNHAQMIRMLRGKIRDTPAMKAALKRANMRAKRAWGMIGHDDQPLDRDVIHTLIRELESKLLELKAACEK